MYPDAEVMICGGHAGKAHLKQLGVWAKKKSFSKAMKTMYGKEFPQVESAVCHCKNKHAPGCWHPALVKWCLHLKFKSSSAYHAL